MKWELNFDEIVSIYRCKLTFRCYLEQESTYDGHQRIVTIECLKLQPSYGGQIVEEWDKCSFRMLPQ